MAELEDIQLGEVDEASYQIRFEPSPKWIRALFGGETVADSKRAMLMLESGRIAVYYFPEEDVRTDLLVPGEKKSSSPRKGPATYFSIVAGGRTAEDAAWRYLEPPPGCPDLSGMVAFYWSKMDAWFEEDEEVFGHPHDPYHRIDILESSRHVRVDVEGETLAETTHPKLLFETGLPTRYYLPKIDVKMHRLAPSGTTSVCAYKGEASDYWSFQAPDKLVKDVAWSYPAPALEAAKVANMVCFFNEKVDIFVDGERLERPKTPWSDGS